MGRALGEVLRLLQTVQGAIEEAGPQPRAQPKADCQTRADQAGWPHDEVSHEPTTAEEGQVQQSHHTAIPH